MFQMVGVGLMMGQVMFFQCIVVLNGYDEFYLIQCYVDESCCLLDVFDKCLDGWDFLVGDSYFIVDIVIYFWVWVWLWVKFDIIGFDYFKVWLKCIDDCLVV